MQSTWNPAIAKQILDAHAAREGALLPILHALQEAFGRVPAPAKPMIAEALNLSLAEVHGVISFYHDFREHPAGRAVIKLCRAEACQAQGARRVAHEVLTRLGLEWGETTADGRLTVESVYCLGLCAVGPAALIDTRPLGAISADSLLAAVGLDS